MTIHSLEDLLRAQARLANAEPGTIEYHEAEKAYIAAERSHLAKLGVPGAQSSWWQVVVPIALVVLLSFTLAGVVKLSYDQSNSTKAALVKSCEEFGNPRVRQSNARVPLERAELKGLLALSVMLRQADPGQIAKADPLVLQAFRDLPDVDQVKEWLANVKHLPLADCAQIAQ